MLFLPPFRWTLKSGPHGLTNTLPADLACRWWTDNLVGGLRDSWTRFITGYSFQHENSSDFISMALPLGGSNGHAEDYRGTKQRNMEPDEGGWRASNSQTLQTRVDVESVLPVGGIYRKWRSVCGEGMGDRDLLVLFERKVSLRVEFMLQQSDTVSNIWLKFGFLPLNPPCPPGHPLQLYLHLNLHFFKMRPNVIALLCKVPEIWMDLKRLTSLSLEAKSLLRRPPHTHQPKLLCIYWFILVVVNPRTTGQRVGSTPRVGHQSNPDTGNSFIGWC